MIPIDIHFNHFPKEIITCILKDIIVHDRTLNCRFVCKHWKDIIDKDVLKIFISQLQKRANEIPKTLGLKSIVIEFTDQANPKNVTTLQCDFIKFQEFNERLKKAIGSKNIPFVFSVEQINELTIENTNLHILWNEIKDRVTPQPSFPLQTALEISNWMHDHPEALSSIIHLNLNGKGLTSLPSEIGYLSQLLDLNLTNNKLHNLPKEIGNCFQLQRLFLDNNQLQSLPEEIKNCTQLISISLDNNQLQCLPKEIEDCSQLRYLFLKNNRLQSLPKEMGNCSQLEYLNLCDNLLQSFPKEIEKCSHLRFLLLSKNQLQSLPKEMGSWPQLERLSLDNNPLLFIDDKILSSSKAIFVSNPQIQQFKEERRYPVVSKFAQLYQAIITRENENEISEKIKTAFNDQEFKKEDQHLIFKMVYVCSGSPKTDDLQWGEHHVFDRPDIFFRAVREAGLAKFNASSPELKNKTYRQVYDLAGKPNPADVRWGKYNALKNLTRLFDVVDGIFSGNASC